LEEQESSRLVRTFVICCTKDVWLIEDEGCHHWSLEEARGSALPWL